MQIWYFSFGFQNNTDIYCKLTCFPNYTGQIPSSYKIFVNVKLLWVQKKAAVANFQALSQNCEKLLPSSCLSVSLHVSPSLVVSLRHVSPFLSVSLRYVSPSLCVSLSHVSPPLSVSPSLSLYLRHVFPSLSVSIEQLDSHSTDFRKIRYQRILRKCMPNNQGNNADTHSQQSMLIAFPQAQCLNAPQCHVIRYKYMACFVNFMQSHHTRKPSTLPSEF